jgi:hypothetical protein
MGAVRTRRKAIFGAKMRNLRENSETKPSPAQVAEVLIVTPTTITRMEGGMSAPQWGQVLACLTLYKATEDQIREVKALWVAAKRPMTTVDNAADLPPNYVAFRRDEADAQLELSMHYTAVSGLLQEQKYAAAIFEETSDERHTEAAEIRAAKDRQARQALLDGPHGLRVHAIMDEMVLHRQVGGPAVLRGQLGHLLDLANLPNVTIQIVPFSAGAWATMNGPVIILRFGSEEDPDLAYLEHAGGGATVENVPDVKKLVGIHEAVAKHKATSPAKSVRLIGAARDALRKE